VGVVELANGKPRISGRVTHLFVFFEASDRYEKHQEQEIGNYQKYQWGKEKRKSWEELGGEERSEKHTP
jgi:hypothetical protein